MILPRLAVTIIVALGLMGGSGVLAAEKLKVGSSIKMSPIFYLPIKAAAENDTWGKNGLEAEWVPFRGAAPMFRAAAAKSIMFGMATGTGAIPAAARGVPVVMVSDLQSNELFVLYVRANSKVRKAEELKGAKMGTPRLGGSTHAMALVVARAHGLEKDVRMVATGGIRELMAGLKTGVVDTAIEPVHLMIKMQLAGDIRELLRLSDYHAKEWAHHVLFASKEFIQNKPDTLKRAVKASLQATNFIQDNRAWTTKTMMETSGFSEEATKHILKDYSFSRTGRLSRKGVQNLRDFLIEYKIISKEKAPPVDELYTDKFLP